MGDTAVCERCGADRPAMDTRCPTCGHQSDLPSWVGLVSAVFALVATITGLIAMAATASVIAGDRSVSTIAGVVVFGGITVLAAGAIYLVRTRGARR